MKQFAAVFLFLTVAGAAEKKMALADLPPAVKSAVTEQTKGATILGISKETEKGQTMYEVETKVDGRTRDLMFDTKGAVVTVEQELDLAAVPAAAKAAIEKKAAGADIKKVESVTTGTMVSYEATLVRKGKSSELAVNADGSLKK